MLYTNDELKQKKYSFVHGLLEAYNLAKRIVMAYYFAWFLRLFFFSV